MIGKLELSTHEAVIYLLSREGGGMSAEQLAEAIKNEKLCVDARGNFPTTTDINRRVSGSTYKSIFPKRDGLIFHNPVEDKRLMRLTYNTNGWTKPVGHKWSMDKRDGEAAFENQWGFGFEEWLFNEAFFQDGYQYGFIRGVEFIKNLYTTIREVYLFTINQDTSERFLVGRIHNVRPISKFSTERKIAEAIFERAMPMMREQLRAVGADPDGLKELAYLPVRFRPEEVVLFDQQVPVPELATREWARFRPFKIEGALEQLLSKLAPKDVFRFEKGRGRKGGSLQRTVAGGSSDVSNLHVQIMDQLELFLDSSENPFPGDWAIEKSYFGWHRADVVIKHRKGTYSIFEVKTSLNLRFNVRDALGQLLDYACWYPDAPIERLVIVSPERMPKRHQEYFDRIQAVLSIPLHYWWFEEAVGKFHVK